MELIAANLAQLHILEGIIRQLTVSQYAQRSKLPHEPSIGRHIRHILDHYLQLLEAIKKGKLDYALRTREAAVETQPEVALTRIATIREALHAFGSPYSHPLVYQSATAPMASNLARELDFVCSHTIHHLALINIILTELGLDIEFATGIHSSTLEYERQCAQ